MAPESDGMGERIRGLRLMAGWEGKEFAGRCGISPSALSKIEAGKQTPTPGQLSDMARTLTEAEAFRRLTRSEIREVLYGERSPYVVTEEVRQPELQKIEGRAPRQRKKRTDRAAMGYFRHSHSDLLERVPA